MLVYHPGTPIFVKNSDSFRIEDSSIRYYAKRIVSIKIAHNTAHPANSVFCKVLLMEQKYCAGGIGHSKF